ncbi:MAG: hypothetical protein IKO22_04875 [Oscillospiraceae bacterium]|nr:hypothetical protein [Oscillospiraceae bacterium]
MPEIMDGIPPAEAAESASIQDNTAARARQRGGRRKWSKSGHTILQNGSKVRSMAVKCYDEQLPYGWQYVQSKIKAVDPALFHIVAIKHDKDTVSDDSFWKTALEKAHYHILLRSAKNESYYVKDLLLNLGIVFRPGEDDPLWDHHAVETVNNFAGYTTYLTHETEDAVSAGEAPYGRGDLVSNLNAESLDKIREGYFSTSGNTQESANKALEELESAAYATGYALKDFDAWYDAQPSKSLSNARMKTIRNSYDRGVRKRTQEQEAVRKRMEKQGKFFAHTILDFMQELTGERPQFKTYSEALSAVRDAMAEYRSVTEEAAKQKAQELARAEFDQKWEDALEEQKAVLTELEELRDKLRKAVDTDASRKRFMEARRYKDGTTLEDAYQKTLRKRRAHTERLLEQAVDLAARQETKRKASDEPEYD